MIIRAVTLFYPIENGRLNDEDLREELRRLKGIIDRVSGKYGIEVRTWRVTLPFLESSWDFRELSMIVNRVSDGLGYIHSSLNVPMYFKVNVDDLVSAFLKSNSYMSIWVGDDERLDENNVDLFMGILKKLVDLGSWVSSRRIAALIGDAVLTPYYPDSINLGNRHGIALSLLYADDILKEGNKLVNALNGIFRRAEVIGKEIAEELGVEYLGIDASLSPWGLNSVVKAIEGIYGLRFGEPGTLSAIYDLNRSIWRALEDVKSTGFNEVMLPVAEDELLKSRVREGLVTFSKLIKYTVSCVAGIDMVPIPSSQLGLLRGLIRDLHAIVSIKRRSMGLRLIPYPGNEAEVDLGDFGSTPVMDMLR